MDRRVGGMDGIGTYLFRSYLLGDFDILPFGSSGSFRRGRRLDVVRAPKSNLTENTVETCDHYNEANDGALEYNHDALNPLLPSLPPTITILGSKR